MVGITLRGIGWNKLRKDKEILTKSHKAINQSVMHYDCTIWTPTLSNTNWGELQTCENTALRTIIGNVKIGPISHPLNETKILPVKEHCHMLSEKFLLATQKQENPDHINRFQHHPETGTPAYNINRFHHHPERYNINKFQHHPGL